MKKLLALLTALCLLLCALPAAGEDAPETPQAISTAAYIQALEEFTGLELEWLSSPTPDSGLTSCVCTTMGSPALISSGDTLVAVTTVSLYDPAELQDTFDAAMFQLIVALGPVCMVRGTPEEDVFTPLSACFNAEGFVPGVTRVLTTGEPFTFDFGGHVCSVSLEGTGEETWVSLFMIVDPDIWFDQ